jgi:hypothetical protein
MADVSCIGLVWRGNWTQGYTTHHMPSNMRITICRLMTGEALCSRVQRPSEV